MTQIQQEDRGEVALYEMPDGRTELEVRLYGDTVWLSQKQMGELFGKNVRTISEHIRNVFKEGELSESSVIRNFRITAADGKSYETQFYNLDVIISVGYRVKSKRGTQFRIWATQTLKEHLTRGYTLNRQRLEENARELEAALQLVRKTAAGEAMTTDQGRGLVDVIARYTQTFLLLQRYDEGLLTEPKGTPGGTLPPLAVAQAAIAELKESLVARGEAGDLFGRVREDGLASILGNLDQSVFGAPAYPSVESKAAHLSVFHHQEPPVQRRQQAHRLVPVRGFPQPQRPPVPQWRADHQRRGAGGAGAAGGRVRSEGQGCADSSGHEHAGRRTAGFRYECT